MSNPANVLDRFQTYSYHHILYACDNSQAANKIASDPFVASEFNDLGIRQDVTEDIITVQEDEQGNITETRTPRVIGQRVVLINGLRDSRYVIQKAEWESLTAANVNNTDYNNSLAVEGNMTIQEPRGFEFMNVIDYVQDAFETDATGIIFVLKTIWRGHNDTGSFSSSQDGVSNIIADVRPLQFMLVDITATFDSAGGMYNLKFVGLNNGASRLPQISRGAEVNSFTPTTRVLNEVMGEFAEKLTDYSTTTHKNVVEQVKRSDSINEEDANNLRRVEYKIEMKPPYNEPQYVLDNFDPTTSEDGTKESVGPIHTGVKFTVEQVIQRIMSMCSLVQTELNEGVDGVKYRYKIQSAIEMQRQPSQTDDNNTSDTEVIQVTYFVERFPELTNVSVTELLSRQRGDDTTTEQQIRDNLITFDYIFTGANVDIKNFDMKLNQGLLFLQTLRTTDNKMDQQQRLNSGIPSNKDVVVGNLGYKATSSEDDPDAPNPQGQEAVRNSIRNRTPVFPGTSVKDVVSKNINTPENMTAFNAAMQQHAALEVLQTTLTIRGNPYLLSVTNRPAREDLDDDPTSDEEDEIVRPVKNWDRIPAIAQVNIRMPENSDTLSSDNSPELIPFWYQGYYYIFGIKHTFEGGEFSQKLDMLSMPQNNFFDPLEASEVNDTADSENNEGDSDGTADAANTTQRQTQAQRRESRSASSFEQFQARQQVDRVQQPRPNTRGERKRRRQNQDNG